VFYRHNKTRDNYDDLRKKIDRLNNQLGDLNGENTQYRNQVENLEEDKKILQERIRRLESEVESQRRVCHFFTNAIVNRKYGR